MSAFGLPPPPSGGDVLYVWPLSLSVFLFPGAFPSYFLFPDAMTLLPRHGRGSTASQPSKGSIEAEEGRELAGREWRTEKLTMEPALSM